MKVTVDSTGRVTCLTAETAQDRLELTEAELQGKAAVDALFTSYGILQRTTRTTPTGDHLWNE